MSKAPVLILGRGGMSLELRDLLQMSSTHDFKGFLDDFSKDADVVGATSMANKRNEKLCCGISNYKNMGKRQKLLQEISADKFIGFRHQLSVVSPSAVVDPVTLVFPFSVIAAEVKINRHVILYHHVTVSHHCSIGEFSILSNAVTLSGSVNVGKNCYIGVGAVIKENVKIGDGSLVAAGAVVLKDVPPGVIYISEAKQKPNPFSKTS